MNFSAWILDRLKGDKLIWLVIISLSLISLLAIYSSTSTLAFKLQQGNTEYYLVKHFILLGIGFVVMYAIHLFDYRIFAVFAKPILIITIPLLAYTLFFGENINEASRWISVFGQSFQPSDLAKMAILIFLAKALTENQSVLEDFNKGFLNLLIWVVVICGLVAPADLSTAGLIFLTSIILMFIGGVKIKYILSLGLAGIILLGFLFQVVPRAETWKSRIATYTEQWTDPDQGPSYQNVQANIAIAEGGFFGKGVGKSHQKNYLPQPYSDFVFAIILEEYGFLGGLIVLGLYILLLIRSVGIVTISRTFGALLASGLSILLVMQALINMAVTVGLFPVTGLPLPLISMGGTSLLFSGISLGIILSVSRFALENKLEETDV